MGKLRCALKAAARHENRLAEKVVIRSYRLLLLVAPHIVEIFPAVLDGLVPSA